SRDALDMLNARQQELVRDAAREAAWWGRDEVRRREGEILDGLRAAGVTVHEFSAEARERFRSALAHIPRKFEERIGPDVMAKLSEWLDLRGRDQSDRQEILIGLDAQWSGESALVGLELKRGVTLAIEGINAQGGVLGRKLRLVARDNHGLATRGVDNLKFFAGLDDLVAVIGGQKSSVMAAEVEAVHDLALPFLLPWSAAWHLTENGYAPNQVFRLSLNDRWTAPFLAEAALTRGARIALVLENSRWGHEFERIILRHLNGRDVRPVAVLWVDNGSRGSSALLSARLAEVGVDVVILVDTPDESIPLLLELSRSLPTVGVVSHWGLLGARLTPAQLLALSTMDLVFPQTFFPAVDKRSGESLRQRMQQLLSLEEGETPVSMGSGFVQAYDLVRMLAGAITLAGSLERGAIRDALERLPRHDGVIKHHRPPFDAQRHDALGIEDYRLGRLAADGQIVPVEPVR
ncbi:MAG: ABC transporter substrate-binding protein, partial [Magnetococcales bacterium]|nr:ABC transporter substrate-binding protein [Magnetococcales bacterium]